MSDNEPSGCGNDFALDDITFRECVKQTTQVTRTSKNKDNKTIDHFKAATKKAYNFTRSESQGDPGDYSGNQIQLQQQLQL